MEPFEVFLNAMSGLSLPEQMFQCAKAVWRTTEKMQGVPPVPQPSLTTPVVPPPGSALNPAGAIPGSTPPYAAPPGADWHWERNSMGWIKVFTDPRIYNPDGTLKANPQREYKISDRAFYLAKTGQASDPAVSDLVDAWNAAGGGGVAGWRAAAGDFGGKFKNACMTIRNLLLEQYPQDAADINWSNDSAEAGA